MATLDDSVEPSAVDEMLKESLTEPDFLIDGIHFGRGDIYYDENASTQLKHLTTHLKCWRIVNEYLEEIEDVLINNLYNHETYIIQWGSIMETWHENKLLHKKENEVYFYWKGEDAPKGYSPLPETIEKNNPPVERITQWSEPPAFLQLFSGTFVVHIGKHGDFSDNPHLYILRGEMEKEIHLYEVPLRKENLRSRTSFTLFYPKEKSSIIWHGNKSNSRSRTVIKTITEKLFGSNIVEINEGSENDTFLQSVVGNDYHTHTQSKIIDYTPRLFYFNNITGNFLATEIECSHKSPHIIPFPFLQTHLYSAAQPAIFLLDDQNEIWIWQGWQCDENKTFKTDSFMTAINYAKQKSKLIKSLVKVQKVVAGFEPLEFTNLFPTWIKRDDIVQLQMKEGVLQNTNPLIEVISHENSQ